MFILFPVVMDVKRTLSLVLSINVYVLFPAVMDVKRTLSLVLAISVGRATTLTTVRTVSAVNDLIAIPSIASPSQVNDWSHQTCDSF